MSLKKKNLMNEFNIWIRYNVSENYGNGRQARRKYWIRYGEIKRQNIQKRMERELRLGKKN